MRQRVPGEGIGKPSVHPQDDIVQNVRKDFVSLWQVPARYVTAWLVYTTCNLSYKIMKIKCAFIHTFVALMPDMPHWSMKKYTHSNYVLYSCAMLYNLSDKMKVLITCRITNQRQLKLRIVHRL